MSRKPQHARDLEQYKQDALENEQAADSGRLFPETASAAKATDQETKLRRKARLLGMRTAPLRAKDKSPLKLPPDKLRVWAKIEEASFGSLVNQARQSVWNADGDDPYIWAENSILEVAENFAKGKLTTTHPGGLVQAFQKTQERRVKRENKRRKEIASTEQQVFDGDLIVPVDDPGDTSTSPEEDEVKGLSVSPKHRAWPNAIRTCRCAICDAWTTQVYCRTCERETWMQPKAWEASQPRWQTNDRPPSWYPERAQTIRVKQRAQRYADLADQEALDLSAYCGDLEEVQARRDGGYESYEKPDGQELDAGSLPSPRDSWERLWFDSLLEQAQRFQWMPPALQNLTPNEFRAWIEGVEGAVPDVAPFRPYRRQVLRALRREIDGPPQIRVCRQCGREFEGSDRAFYCGPRCRKAASRAVSRAVA